MLNKICESETLKKVTGPLVLGSAFALGGCNLPCNHTSEIEDRCLTAHEKSIENDMLDRWEENRTTERFWSPEDIERHSQAMGQGYLDTMQEAVSNEVGEILSDEE